MEIADIIEAMHDLNQRLNTTHYLDRCELTQEDNGTYSLRRIYLTCDRPDCRSLSIELEQGGIEGTHFVFDHPQIADPALFWRREDYHGKKFAIVKENFFFPQCSTLAFRSFTRNNHKGMEVDVHLEEGMIKLYPDQEYKLRSELDFRRPVSDDFKVNAGRKAQILLPWAQELTHYHNFVGNLDMS